MNGSTAFAGLMVSSKGIGNMASQISALNTIRIGIIGCGSRGVGLGTLFKQLPGVKLTAFCDILPNRVTDGLAQVEKTAKGYNDHRKLLDSKDVDAVVIATPLFLHYPMAVDALKAGKHVYLEKSLAYDIQQSLDLPGIVKESKKVFQVGYQYRYYNMYHKVKEVIDSGWVGKVTHFECQYNQNTNWRKPVSDPKLERILNWRMYREYCGGPLSELCAHQIDMVNYILNSHPLSAVGSGSINYWKDGRETYDNIRVIYDYPGGITSTCTSILSNGYNGYNIRVLADNATLDIQRDKIFIYGETRINERGTVDGVTGATVKARTQGERKEIPFRDFGEQNVEPTTYAIQDFIKCIRENKKPVSNVDNAKESSIAIHLGNAAADTGTKQLWKPEYSA